MSGRPFPKGNSFGFQKGNRLAAKNRLFEREVKQVLLQGGDGIEAKRALRSIAESLVRLAIKGNLDAIKEVADRIDGKPRQVIVGQIEHRVYTADATELRERLERRLAAAAVVDTVQ